jgi:hypothetical protein
MKNFFFLFSLLLLSAYLITGCNDNQNSQSAADGKGTDSAVLSKELTAEDARKIAKEAYIFGYPMIDGYRIQHTYFVNKDNTEYKAPFNILASAARVYTADDKAVQTPNSDTPYGMLGMDLRAEPMVITVPKMETNRYFSIQLIDAFTHNFSYIGSRTTGNGGGSYLIAGPDWKGELPKGIDKIIPCETNLALAIVRTQLFNPADLKNVANIQKNYKVQPLSAFLGSTQPQAAAAINFMPPLSGEEMKTSVAFFNVLNFLLQYCPEHPSEKELRQNFARIGIIPGASFDSTQLKPEILQAIKDGMADAWTEFEGLKQKTDSKEVTSGDLFGTRDQLKNNYLYRMGGAIIGIYGNTKEEAMYPIYSVDSEGAALNGANAYTLTFSKDNMPPVNAFWSFTMYELPSSLLTKNPINRYLINSPMLPQLKKNADGGFTIYLQNKTPGKDKESNWLPAPSGDFMVVLRLYWPKEEALSGKWTASPMVKVK